MRTNLATVGQMEAVKRDTESAYRADAAAVADVIAGHTEAFQPLVQRYFTTVCAVANAELRDFETVEEIAQEAFLRAYLGLTKLRDPRYFAVWIHRIARNLAVEWNRQSCRKSRLLQMVPYDDSRASQVQTPGMSAREQLQHAEEQSRVQSAIQALTPALREVVLLHFAEDLPPAEIARRLGLNRSSVSRRLDKALRLLREQLAGQLLVERPVVTRLGHAEAKTMLVVAAVAAAPAATRAAISAAAGALPASGVIGGGTGMLFSGAFHTAAGKTMLVAGTVAGLATVGVIAHHGGEIYKHSHSKVVSDMGTTSAATGRLASKPAPLSTTANSHVKDASASSAEQPTNRPGGSAAGDTWQTYATSATKELSAGIPLGDSPAFKVTRVPSPSGHNQTRVSGTVWYNDGTPAATAKVQVYRERLREHMPDDLLGEIATGSNGSYSIKTAPMLTGYLLVRKKGCATAFLPIDYDQGGWAPTEWQFQQDVVLKPAVSLSGRIISTGGAAISCATLHALATNPKGTVSAEVSATKSRDKGEFEFTDVSTGTILLAAEAHGYMRSSRAADCPNRDVVTTLATGGATIAGTVTQLPDEIPAAGAAITVAQIDTTDPTALPVTVASSATGDFLFENLHPGLYTIDAKKDNLRGLPRIKRNEHQISLRDNETTAGIEIALYAGHTVKGTVRDKATRQPLKSVNVTHDFSVVGGSSTFTDSEGKYILTEVFQSYPGNADRIDAKLPGYWIAGSGYQHTIELQLPRDKFQVSCDFEMDRATSISGIVLTDEREPVPSVSVSLFSGQARGSDVSDANGLFSIDVPRYTEEILMAEVPDRALALSQPIQVRDDPVTGVQVIAGKPAIVSGVVLNEQKSPLTGAKVYASRPVYAGGMSSGLGGKGGISDSNGRFSIPVTGGEVSVYAELQGYPAVSAKFQVPPGESKSDVELILKKGHYLAGRVIRKDGSPAAGEQMQADSSTCVTDSEGRYRIEGLDKQRVTVSIGGMRSEAFSDVLTDRDNADFTIDTKLAITLIGKVVDAATKEPAPDFTVHVSGRGEMAITQPTRDPQRPGYFTLPNLADTFIEITISAPGYKPLTQTLYGLEMTDRERRIVEKEFKLGQGATIYGHVIRRGDQSPVAGAKVEVSQALNVTVPLGEAMTALDGTYRIADLPAGALQVRVTPPAPLPPVSNSYKVWFGDPIPLPDFLVGEAGLIRGRVLNGGAAAAGETVSLGSSDEHVNVHQVSDAQGRFEFRKVPTQNCWVMLDSNQAKKWIDVKPDGNYEIVLYAGGGKLQGHVVRAGSGLQADVSITNGTSGNSQTVKSDADGNFKAELVPGSYTVSVFYQQRWYRNVATLEMPVSGDVERTLELPATHIIGLVVDASGKPAHANIACWEADRIADISINRPAVASTNQGGEFTLDAMQPARYLVSAASEKDGCSDPQLVELTAARDEKLMLQLKSGGNLRLRLLSLSTGQPLRSLSTTFAHNGVLVASNTAGPEDDGSTLYTNLQPGEYHVSIRPNPTGLQLVRTVHIEAGKTSTLEEVVSPGGSLLWILTNAQGLPLRDAECTLVPVDAVSIQEPVTGKTDSKGRWNPMNIAPGRYRAQANAKGASASSEVQVLDREQVEVMSVVQ